MQTLDMHSQLESYANKLAEVELRQRASSTPESEDEHGLLARYCHSLYGNDQSHVLKSPMQIVMAMDVGQRLELQNMISDLKEENRVLQVEYDQLKQAHDICYVTIEERELDGDLKREAEMMVEAKLLRQHKDRLESRMQILEEHNQQLETQLSRLRLLVDPDIDNIFPSSLTCEHPYNLLEASSQESQPPNLTSYSSASSYGHHDIQEYARES